MQLFAWLMQHLVLTLKVVVSEGEFPSFVEVNTIYKKTIGRSKDKGDAIIKYKALEDKLQVLNPDLSFFDLDLLERIDREAITAYRGSSLDIGTGTDEDKNALAKYVEGVLDILKKERSSHPALDRIRARFKYIMTSQSTTFPAIPLCTAFVQKAILSSLSKLDRAIDFVSVFYLTVLHHRGADSDYRHCPHPKRCDLGVADSDHGHCPRP
jgi:hypothetical protein